ncbi:MAG: hypothetical protein ACP5HZ_08650 [Ferrimicrobium sp.]
MTPVPRASFVEVFVLEGTIGLRSPIFLGYDRHPGNSLSSTATEGTLPGPELGGHQHSANDANAKAGPKPMLWGQRGASPDFAHHLLRSRDRH